MASHFILLGFPGFVCSRGTTFDVRPQDWLTSPDREKKFPPKNKGRIIGRNETVCRDLALKHLNSREVGA